MLVATAFPAISSCVLMYSITSISFVCEILCYIYLCQLSLVGIYVEWVLTPMCRAVVIGLKAPRDSCSGLTLFLCLCTGGWHSARYSQRFRIRAVCGGVCHVLLSTVLNKSLSPTMRVVCLQMGACDQTVLDTTKQQKKNNPTHVYRTKAFVKILT